MSASDGLDGDCTGKDLSTCWMSSARNHWHPVSLFAIGTGDVMSDVECANVGGQERTKGQGRGGVFL